MTAYSYWEEIERYFTKKRGNALILSPKDWPLVTSWQEQGIPLELIYEGIDNAFARLEQKQSPAQRRTLRTLNACRYDVEKLWNAHKEVLHMPSEQMIDDAQQGLYEERQRLLAKLRSVIAQLQKTATDPHYKCIAQELSDTIGIVQSFLPTVERAEDKSILARIQERMRQQEQILLSALEQTLTPEMHAALLAKVDSQLASYRHTMKPAVYEETRRIAFVKILRDTYPLPSFF